jgi:hypothetical protein
MKGDDVYTLMTNLLIFVIIELAVAVTNQFYVPRHKKYEELTVIQKILVNLRFYFNIIETILITYVLFNYHSYLNYLTILLLVSILLACIRYFLFALEWIYYFINKTKKNIAAIEFIEGTFGKIQNIGILLLLIYIVIQIYFFRIY